MIFSYSNLPCTTWTHMGTRLWWSTVFGDARFSRILLSATTQYYTALHTCLLPQDNTMITASHTTQHLTAHHCMTMHYTAQHSTTQHACRVSNIVMSPISAAHLANISLNSMCAHEAHWSHGLDESHGFSNDVYLHLNVCQHTKFESCSLPSSLLEVV